MTGIGKNSSIWRVGRLEQLFRRTGLFLWTIRGTAESETITGYADHWRGSPIKGSQIMSSSQSTWIQGNHFNEFEWLRHLRAFGGSQARSRARGLINKWMEQNSQWNVIGWRPDIMAKRLTVLVFCFDWYGSSADELFKQKIGKIIRLQVRCLAIDWRRLHNPEDRVSALRGLIITEAALSANVTDLDNLMELLVPLVDGMLHTDGGHKSRMPNKHLLIMRDLIEIRNTGIASQLEQFCWLNTNIAKMSAICRMWRHADGQFARFNGAGLMDPEIIEETLAHAGQKGKLLQQAPHTGFMRFTSGRSTVILDVGQPTQNASITGLSTLGFEFAVGQNLLVINPGQSAADDSFRRLLCNTQAHSTVTIDGQNSTDFSTGRIAEVSNVELGPAKGGLLGVASHNGYEKSHGIIHHRKLYLTTGGSNLRGADHLEYSGSPGEIASFALIRFHLHPKVTAAMLRDHRVLIKIRGNRMGWVFRASASVSLETSLFFDINGRMNCQQIVVKVSLANIRSVGNVKAKWAFQRSEPS